MTNAPKRGAIISRRVADALPADPERAEWLASGARVHAVGMLEESWFQ
jgi:hypothetical protein